MAAAGSPSTPQFASLYVGDLHHDVTEAMLYEIFNSVGPVGSIRVCRDSVTRRSLGYGYVNFHSVSDAERALDTLNYSSIKGRSCRIMWSQRDPSLRKSGSGNVFVKNLDSNIDNKALYDTFSLFGNILSCKVATESDGKSRGYGFVHYETDEAANQAIERVHGMQIGERTVEVTKFTKRAERHAADKTNFTNIYIKHVPESWDEAKILSTFGTYGKVTSHCIREDKQGRQFAFVNLEEPEQAVKAVAELHGKDVRTDEEKAAKKGEDEEEGTDGPLYKLYVVRAQTKGERAIELSTKGGNTSAPTGSRGVNLYIKNLDEATTDADLKALFEAHGTISSAVVNKDDKGRCKGFGFVCFASSDEATKAITEMHLKVIKGKPLYVGLAEKKEARQERLRQRYQASAGGMMGKGGGKGGKGGKGGAMGGKGGCMGPMGPMGVPGGQGGVPMMGMMGMMGAMNPQMMGKGMMGPMGPMAMGKGGCPQMMGGPMMMGKGGPMMGQMGAMGGKGMMGPMGPMGPMGGKGMMMPGGVPGGAPAPRPGGAQQQQAPAGGLSGAALAAAPPGVQKQMIGEKLFPCIARMQPEQAGKITGMMLEMDNSELLILLESEAQLRLKVDEALRVLDQSK